MIIGSHNSWSYLPPKTWWMKLIGFTAKCQRYNVATQFFRYGVKCFDLRLRFDGNGLPIIVHGPVEYKINLKDLYNDLEHLNIVKDCYIRVILDLRKRGLDDMDKTYQRNMFSNFCIEIEEKYPNIKFWCGRMLPTWATVHSFVNHPSCEEYYGSVSKPKWLWGWWPWLYAKKHNKDIIKEGTDKDILLIDYVDIM